MLGKRQGGLQSSTTRNIPTFAMTSASDWQARVGDVWAAEWRRTDRSFAGLSRQLNAAILTAVPSGPATVMDIGCGAGGTSLALAAARPDLRITGVDLSPALIEVARARAAGPESRFRVADALVAAEELNPDLLVSRHGVMFFADPVAAFTRLRAAAAPGAPLVFTCFRARALNPWAGELVAALTGHAPADPAGYAPGPFGFADRVFVTDLLATAGWTRITAEPIDFAYVAGAGPDPIADGVSYLSRIGPAASAIAAVPQPDRAGLRTRLAELLAPYRTDSHVQVPAAAWLWRAQAGDPR